MKEKIFLNMTKKSVLDVTANLAYYESRQNEKGKVTEDIYKGKIYYSITERGEDGKALYENNQKKYLQGFMLKETAKIVFQSISNDSFLQRFGESGIKDFAGAYTKNGRLCVKNMYVRPILNKENNRITHYVFSICEGYGKSLYGGRKTVIDGDPYITVENHVKYMEALKMAAEVYDYIRDMELINMQKGTPLYTIMYGKEGKQEESPKNEKQVKDITENDYIIDVEGQFYGRNIRSLEDTELQWVLSKTENEKNPKAKEIYKHAVQEAKRRLSNAL